MHSASLSSRAPARGSADLFTEGESSFRNAKLRNVLLVAYKTIADIGGKGSTFVITMVAARRLTPWAFGVFGLGTTAGWMLAVATDFGVQMHLARAVAQAPADARALLRRWWRTRVVMAAGGMALLAAVLMASRAGAALAVPVVLLALVYVLNSLIELVNYFYRGLSRSDLESTLTLWQRGSTLVVGVGALLWRPDVGVLAASLLVPVLATLAATVAIAGRLGSKRSNEASAVAGIAVPAIAARWRGGRRSRAFDDRFFRDVFPIGLGIVLSALYFRIDVLLVQLWLGTEAVAGYNAVFRLIDALRLFPAAVLAVTLPVLCRAGDLRPLAYVSAAVTGGALVVAAILWLTSDRVVTLAFGTAYRGAVPAFRVLVLALPLLSLNFALTHQLVGWNQQRAYAVVCAAALAVNLALNAWLIPALSIEGAAWATLGTELCVTSGCLVALRSRI
jgi:O-antigen/teichoic acid export membrane protein